MSGLLCAGDLYVSRLDDSGNPVAGYLPIGNATRFAIQENTEKRERISKRRATYGQALDTVYVKQPATLALTLDDIDKDNLALAFLGESTSADVTAGSVTDEPAVAKLGVVVQLANYNIDDSDLGSSFSITNTAKDETFVAGTDYEVVNARMGLIKFLSGGTVTDDEDVLVNYDHLGVTGSVVNGGTKQEISAKLLLDGRNLATGEKIIVEVDKSSLAPTSEVDLLSDEFVTLEMEGTPITVSGDSSYRVRIVE